MRPLQLLALSGLLLASNIALADKFDDNVPARCWDVCGPVVGMARQCDNMHRGGDDDGDDDADDRAEMRCICDWNQAPTLVPLCQACIAQNRNNIGNIAQNGTNVHNIAQNGTVIHPGNDRDDDHDDDRDHDRNDGPGDDRKKKRDDDDAYDILRFCSFPTTTYNPAAATSILSSSGISSTGPSRPTDTPQTNNTNTGSNAQTTNILATGSAVPNAVPKAASVAAVVGLIGLAWL
ncbi:hypothetical protein CNMCM5793_004813 [Aspergillus hiratsukae]|uniref:GPI anchored protein n=1 Tax=Aspergillus hiratsukae TaxID=1194566 RepID=A0A8H6UAE6_9EURO|nr:hypothetical protein CNMCM5793_004813 [Aspergillus hiratsukae]KAF7155907.1 hypothetical protein CNMCM6106_007819 [Aspergillus hiratsukae]